MIRFRKTAVFDKPAVLVLLDQEQVKQQKTPAGCPPDIKTRIVSALKAGYLSEAAGSAFPLTLEGTLVVLLNLGDPSKLTPGYLRQYIRTALVSSYLKAQKEIEIVFHRQTDEAVFAAIDAALIGAYSWEKYKSKKIPSSRQIVTLAASSKKAYENAVAAAGGVNLARDLVNDNADFATSEHFEKTILGLVKGKRKFSVEILNRKELKAKGLNLHLAVNQGSNKDPKLIIVKYNGAGKSQKYTAIIGKGMTYDTGGLNLKPTGSIETMRLDKGGAGAVVGTLRNIAELQPKKNILFVVGMAENAIDADSYKPGDVFKSYNGKTVEIGNTDAEGRLVLADAISYTVRNYKPARIFDIATLTGACIIALGYDHIGLVSNNDAFANAALKAAEATNDRAWRLPSYPEIAEAVQSQIADIKNLGWPKGAAGTLTAAEFLRQFTEDTPWVHLDIAGAGFNENSVRQYYGYGATGAGVRLLTRYLLEN